MRKRPFETIDVFFKPLVKHITMAISVRKRPFETKRLVSNGRLRTSREGSHAAQRLTSTGGSLRAHHPLLRIDCHGTHC